MSIFENCVPYVAFWIANGVEKTIACSDGEIVSSPYGLSAKMVINGKTFYCPVLGNSNISEGEKFTSCKVITLRRYGYKYSKTHRLIKVPVKYRYDGTAFVVWRVSELYK